MIKNEILRIAKENKISAVGFCRMEEYYNRIGKDNGGVFSKNTPLNFDAKTAIVFAFGYYANEKSGNISRYAWGRDYHIVTAEKMKPVLDFLTENGFSAKSYADTGVLNERLLAKLSGIAFVGRNRMAINEKLGSYFFIGYVLTDCEIEPDEENSMSCLNCGRCAESCPLGAIGDESFDVQRCMSYISQKKGELSEEEIKGFKKSGKIWGCDVCQEVCPHNIGIDETEIDEFKTDLVTDLRLGEMSNKEFKLEYGNRAFSWRGKGIIMRNQKYI